VKGKVRAICLVAVSLVWLATSCGDAESGEGAASEGSGPESFAFTLTAEGEDSGSRWVETTEGVYDPANGTASAVHTGSGREGEDRLLMVDGVQYLSTPDVSLEGLEDFPDTPGGACSDAAWHSIGPVPEPTGALIDINNPTGLQIEALQEMVTEGADELQPMPADTGQPDGTRYEVDVADIDQDDYRELLDMVVTTDDIGRVVAVDWTVSVDVGGAPSTETMALKLSEFGVPVEVTVPESEDICDTDELSLEFACGFAATDVREEAMGAIASGDRQELTEIVSSFNTSTGGACPESLSVPLLVSSARCDPGMVQFLFEDLEFDPNWMDYIGLDLIGQGTTALFELTYYDPEDDPEFSDVCTPEQDLETIRVLLDAGADPCLAPDAQNGLGPLPGEPQWEAPAIGISEWNEPVEIVELVESAATTCTP
jgi:hypothetical protein